MNKTLLSLLAMTLAACATGRANHGPSASACGIDPNEAIGLQLQARALTPEQATALEGQVAAEPSNGRLHAQLAGYYGTRLSFHEDARAGHVAQQQWFAGTCPATRIAYLRPISVKAEVGYEALATVWNRQVEAHPQDPAVIANAVSFFRLDDADHARALIARGEALSPNDPVWSIELGRIEHLQMVRLVKSNASESELRAAAAKSLASFERASAMLDASGKRDLLPDLADAAVRSGEDAKAVGYAQALLAERTDADAVHRAHVVLGRVALRQNDVAKAKAELLAAAAVKGSGPLGSFGPNMSLAKELLATGERDTVLTYFERCQSFWSNGSEKLVAWASAVNKGETPDFDANLVY